MRLWAVFAAAWIAFAYFYVNPGRDIYKEAFVTLSGLELRVPLDITEERTRKVLIEYRRQEAEKVSDAQLGVETTQIMAEVADLQRRNSAERRFQWETFATVAAAVPATILFVGIIAAWVIAGFRKRPSDS
jgi:hypothetical protein